jgi:predicted membrane protein
MSRSGVSAVSLIGVALVALGAMFLLENSGLLGPDASIVATYWPVLLIAGGLWGILMGGLRFRVWPSILLALGVVFLLSNLGLLSWAGGLLWPAVLIILGLALLSRRRFSARRRQRDVFASEPETAEVLEGRRSRRPEESGDRSRRRKFQAGHFFSGGREQVTSQDFQGGEVSAVFGSMELDLREASLADGEAVLEATVVFGGLELRVPREWRVTIETTTLFGGTEIKRSQPDPSEAVGELTVISTMVFGGIEVKD